MLQTLARPAVAVPDPTVANLAHLARLARRDPSDAGVLQNYALALIQADRVEAALPHLEAALALEPDKPAHHVNLSTTYRRLERDWECAYRHAEEAHRLDPSNSTATHNLAAIEIAWGDPAKAAVWYRATAERDPSSWEAWFNWLYCLDLLPISAEDAKSARASFNAIIERPLTPRLRHANDPSPERKLRLGFLGGDFREHSAAYIFRGVIEHLDRERFEVVLLADAWRYDDLTDWFEQQADRWVDVNGRTNAEIAALVEHDQIDVLIDLGAYSQRSHLMAHFWKPAPLSITAWGYLAGTGLDCIDGILVDETILPRERAWEVTETPCYVPYALGFTPPAEDVEVVPRSADTPLTFGYLGRIVKISDPTVALWAEVLHAYPGSRLVLKDGALREERTASRISARFSSHGIDPDRLEVRYHTPRLEHLATYNAIDVSLDPITQSGGLTPLESLWMGTPTVALCPGTGRLTSRLSASSLRAAGRPAWVARTTEEYIALAGHLSGQGGPQLRADLLGSSACDDVSRARAFEDAVRERWRGWCSRQMG